MYSLNVLMAFLHNRATESHGFGGIVAPNSGCLSLTLGFCTSFSFGVVSVLHLLTYMCIHVSISNGGFLTDLVGPLPVWSPYHSGADGEPLQQVNSAEV